MKLKFINIYILMIFGFICMFININSAYAWENACKYDTVNVYFNDTTIRFEYPKTRLGDSTTVDTSKNMSFNTIWEYYNDNQNFKCPDYIYIYYPCKGNSKGANCISDGTRFYTYKLLGCVSNSGTTSSCRTVTENLQNGPEGDIQDPYLQERKNNAATNPDIPDIKDCKSLLGSPDDKGVNGKDASPAYYISIAFKILRYVAIVILIVFTIIDLLNAVTSHEDDKLKAALRNMLYRFIFCIIIFLLPIIIDVLLRLINDQSIRSCINI